MWRQSLRKLATAASQQVWEQRRRLLDQQVAPHLHGNHSGLGRQPRLCRRCVESPPMLTLWSISQTCPGVRRIPCVGGIWPRLPSSSARSSGLQVSQSVQALSLGQVLFEQVTCGLFAWVDVCLYSAQKCFWCIWSCRAWSWGPAQPR